MPLNFDEDALMRMVHESDGFKAMQERANEHIRDVVRDVNATHSGKSCDDVDAELRAKFTEAGINPTEPGFSNLVRSIADGQLTG